ncbi:RNA polymerase sigma factor SigJ [Jeotgalibacillus proteolyticus]|nr:RNA polymerase sigma factor SigJ [Jeotgalibacillus proteolyticus]
MFKLYQKELFSLAYRMLGSVMDAEDIVQEAFIKFDQLPRKESIQNERAYLYKMVTNRCIDLLRSSSKQRETYKGTWLPEPLVEKNDQKDPSALYLQRETISTAYLLLLQKLNAVERAVFILREVFNYSYDEIADNVEKSQENCRQIYHRAKKSILTDSEEIPSVAVGENHIKSFVKHLMDEDTEKLLELVSEEVILYTDGGGKVRVAGIPVVGFQAVMRLNQNLLRMYEGQFSYSFHTVNGLPGIRIQFDESIDRQFVYSFAFRDGKVEKIYAVANPDKLRHI